MDESSREWRANIKYISLFSGIEAATVAWEPLGWEPLAFCEIEDFPSAVLSYHYPDVPNLGDICKVDWKDVIERHGRPDVVVGGSPCQSFSVAGGRESLDGESRLMFEYIRALAEIRPTWFLWENVPGVLNTRDNAFVQLLREVQDIGYLSLAWRVLDAQFVRVADRDGDGRITGWFGPVAQRRRRVFLVGHLGTGGGAAAVLFESEGVRGNTQTSKQKREELARAAGRGAKASGGEGSLTPWDAQSIRIFSEDSTFPTLQAGCNAGQQRPSVLQSAGFKYHQCAQAGNIGYEDEQSPTLTADYHQPAVALQTGHTAGNGSGVNTEDVSYTLSLANDHAVAFAQNTRDEVRLQNGDGQVTGPISASDSAKGQGVPFVVTNYGEEMAGTLTARADSSPCPDRGQNVVCMASAHANAEICRDMCPTVLSHAAKTSPIVCMADDTQNAAIDENLSGTLKVGGVLH